MGRPKGSKNTDKKEATPAKAAKPTKAAKPAKPAKQSAWFAQLAGEEHAKAVLKAYGVNVLLKGTDVRARNAPRWSTGIYSMDAALGGGWSENRIHTLFGEKSAGKTHTVLTALALAQKSCSRCCVPKSFCLCKEGPRETGIILINSENDWDTEWITNVGLDLEDERFHVVEADFGEKGLDVADALIRSAMIDIVAIDSLAFLTPSKEIQESVGKMQVGEQARMLGKGIRKIVTGMMRVARETERKPTLLMTNQIRMKVGVIFGNPETVSGGHAPRFAACTESRLGRSKIISSEKLGPRAAECKARIVKNKTGRPGMTAEWEVNFLAGTHKHKGSISDEAAIMADAKRFGLMTKDSGWVCMGEHFRVQEDFIERLESDYEYKYSLTSSLLEHFYR